MRAQFDKRVIVLRGEEQRERALAVLRNLPVDAEHPLQVMFDEYRPPRKPDQNALMWAGPLKDIAEQAYFDQRKYSAKVWAEFFKEEFLPEVFDPVLCREGFQKWEEDPRGNRKMVGSTTMLTVKGFSQYLEQIYAFGASLGVQFHTNPNEGR